MKTPTTKKIKSMAAGLSLITFALLDGTAQAGTDTWTGATSANWGDSNWTGANNPPASGDSLIFTSATGVGGTALNNNLTSSGFNVAGLIYNSGAAAFTVSGNAFALTGPITNSSTSLQTINDPFSLSSALIFSTTAGGGNLLLGGSISGAGGITNAGSGTLTLSGANTYTGATTVFAGKLLLGNASALPATTTLTVTNSGILDLNGNSETITNFGVGALTGLITNSASSPAAINAKAWSIGLKTQIADGANGPVAVNFLSVGNATGGSLANTNNNFSGGLTIGNTVSGSGYARFGLAATPVNNGVPGNITNSPFGRGVITIGNAPTDRAQLYINGAATILNNIVFNTALGADRTAGVRVDSPVILPGTLTANLAPVSLSCQSTGNSALLSGQITGTNGFALKNNGSAPTDFITCTMSNVTANANNYQGGTEIDNPFILAMGAANQIPSGANASDVTNNGTWKLNGYNQTINGLWSIAGTVDGVSGTPTLTIGANNESSTNSCVIEDTVGSLSLTKTGTGMATFTGVLSYRGNTTVNGGILSLQQPSFASSSTITIASGGTLDLPNGGSFGVANLIINGVTQPNGTYNSTTDPGYITGSAQLTVTGGSAADTWTGATSANWSQSNWTGGRNPPLSGDSINFTSATGVGGTALNDDLTSSTFEIAGINYSPNAAGFTVSGNAFILAGSISNNSANAQTINDSFALSSIETIITTNMGGSLTLGGSLSGPGGITAAGLGTLALSGANNYAGPTTIGGGKLLLGNASALPATTTLLLTNGGILDLSSNGASISNFNGNTSYSSIITNSSSGTNVITLTVSGWSAGLDSLVVDGATAPVAVSFQSVGSPQGGSLNNNTNNFSGGLTIGNAVTGLGYARLNLGGIPVNNGVPGNITNSPLGRGTITIGNSSSDKAQLFVDQGSTFTILNNIVFNSALGADRVGALRVDQNTVFFAGTMTASNAPVNLACNSTTSVNAAILSGQITGPYGLWLQTNAAVPTAVLTVTLSNLTANANNYQGDTEVDTPHVLALGAANQIPCGPNAGNLILNGTFRLNGNNQTINGLYNTGTPGIVDGMYGTPTLTLGDNDANNEFDGVIQNSGGSLSLTKIGAGNENLTATNTYTGNTTVNAGTLEIGQPCLFQGSTVSVANGATLQLDFSVTNEVAGLVLGGVSQPAGVYNNTTSPSFITGSGSLLVGVTFPTTPTRLSFSFSGSGVNLMWPSNYLGWILQENTNSLINTNAWYDVPGTGSLTSTNVPINPGIPKAFFRLRYP